MRRGMSIFNVASVALGLAFLYLPIVILVIYSFNASRLVTVWAGWSTRWYEVLLHDSAMLEAAWNSLRIAALSATAATVLGTLAANLVMGDIMSTCGRSCSEPILCCVSAPCPPM